jgi:hypothetical protein
MFTPLPHKHPKNANECVTSDILVTLGEGSGHRCGLHLEPLQKVRDRGGGGNSTYLHPPRAATDASISLGQFLCIASFGTVMLFHAVFS